MKPSLFFINFVTTLMIENVVTSARHTTSPLTMGDYILRSCIASVVLIRNHRKSQLPTTNAGETYPMVLNDNPNNKRRLLVNDNTQIAAQHDATWRARGKMNADTPLRTIDIKRGRMTDLIFMKKNYFPEISLSDSSDDKRDENSKIILIKSVKRSNP